MTHVSLDVIVFIAIAIGLLTAYSVAGIIVAYICDQVFNNQPSRRRTLTVVLGWPLVALLSPLLLTRGLARGLLHWLAGPEPVVSPSGGSYVIGRGSVSLTRAAPGKFTIPQRDDVALDQSPSEVVTRAQYYDYGNPEGER